MADEERSQKLLAGARLLWPWIVELWIFLAIAFFFLIRVLESHSAQRFLNGIKSHFSP